MFPVCKSEDDDEEDEKTTHTQNQQPHYLFTKPESAPRTLSGVISIFDLDFSTVARSMLHGS